MEHDKTVDTLIRRLVQADHISEINQYDVRKKAVVWGLKRAQNESVLMQNNERAKQASNFKDLSIKKRKPIQPVMFDDVNQFLNENSSSDEEYS